MAGDGFKKLASGAKSAGEAVFEASKEGAKITGGVAKGAGGVAKGGGKTAVGVADRSAGLLGGILESVSGFAKKHPQLTFFVGAFAAIRAAKKWVNNRHERQQMEQEAASVPMDYAPQPPAMPMPQTQAQPQLAPQQPGAQSLTPDQEAQILQQLAAMSGATQQVGPAQEGRPEEAPHKDGSFTEQLSNQQEQSQGQGASKG